MFKLVREVGHRTIKPKNKLNISSTMTRIQINVLTPNLAIVGVGEQSQEHTIAKCCDLKAVLHDDVYSARVKWPNGTSSATAEGWRGGCVAGSAGSSRRDSP